jgi:hypothetical protein
LERRPEIPTQQQIDALRSDPPLERTSDMLKNWRAKEEDVDATAAELRVFRLSRPLFSPRLCCSRRQCRAAPAGAGASLRPRRGSANGRAGPRPPDRRAWPATREARTRCEDGALTARGRIPTRGSARRLCAQLSHSADDRGASEADVEAAGRLGCCGWASFTYAAAIDAGQKMASIGWARPIRIAGGGQRQVRVGLGSQSSADTSFDGRSWKPSPVCEIALRRSATRPPP